MMFESLMAAPDRPGVGRALHLHDLGSGDIRDPHYPKRLVCLSAQARDASGGTNSIGPNASSV